MMIRSLLCLAGLLCLSAIDVSYGEDNLPPRGFTALFNGNDLTGWFGYDTKDPRKFQALSTEEQQAVQEKSLDDVKQHWTVQNGELVNDGKGLYLTTLKNFGDYELWVDYKTVPKADSGIYLKGTPQVQIWDSMNEAEFKNGSDKGSGGLWNNKPGPGKFPLVLADKPLGEWNTFHIIQIGARTSVTLNDKLVVDWAIMGGYFDGGALPLIPRGPIQLQTHGGEIRWRNIFLREIPSDEARARLQTHGSPEARLAQLEYNYAKKLKEDNIVVGSEDPVLEAKLAKANANAAKALGFESLFNGTDLTGWANAVDNYEVVDGSIRCKAGKGGVLHTKNEYTDFTVRLEIKIPPGGNNGLAIRYPGEGDTAYVGMCELQVLDNEAAQYAKLDKRQYHGSAYGMAPAARGYLRPPGEWNYQEVTVVGSTIKVELNGNLILDTDLSKITEYMANSPHPGKERTSGYFGFAGHGDPVEFRNIWIKSLATETK